MNKFFFSILMFLFSSTYAQKSSGKSGDVLQRFRLSRKEYYFLTQPSRQIFVDSITTDAKKETGFYLEYTADSGKTFLRQAIDSIICLAKLGAYKQYASPYVGCPNQINIFFINKDIGFLYGTSFCYGHFPWLLKTNNGGKTWEVKLAGIGDSFNMNQFYLFDEKRGIAFLYINTFGIGTNKNKLYY